MYHPQLGVEFAMSINSKFAIFNIPRADLQWDKIYDLTVTQEEQKFFEVAWCRSNYIHQTEKLKTVALSPEIEETVVCGYICTFMDPELTLKILEQYVQ